MGKAKAEGVGARLKVRALTVGALWNGSRCVPMLRIRGVWLEVAGFPAGSRVYVEIERGRLVLTVAPTE